MDTNYYPDPPLVRRRYTRNPEPREFPPIETLVNRLRSIFALYNANDKGIPADLDDDDKDLLRRLQLFEADDDWFTFQGALLVRMCRVLSREMDTVARELEIAREQLEKTA